MVILTRKMATDYLVSDRQKPLVGTIGAFDPGLLANPAYPLVGADRGISGRFGPAIFKTARIDIVASPKKRSEKRNLNFRWREVIYVALPLHCFRTILTEEL